MLVDLTDSFATPIHDPVSALVYSALGHEPTLVVIDGAIVMRDRKVLTVDERRVRREAQSAGGKYDTGVLEFRAGQNFGALLRSKMRSHEATLPSIFSLQEQSIEHWARGMVLNVGLQNAFC